MADDTTQAGTQAEPSQQAKPQAGSSPTATTATGTQAEPTSGNSGSEPMSLDEAKKLRSEASSLRKRLAEYEQAQQAAELAKLSDADKAAKRAELAEAALTAARARIGAGELKVAAQAAGIIDPDVAAALLGAKIEYDADGEPKNVADLVAGLKKDKPHLFTGGTQPQRPGASSGGATNPGAVARPGATFTREQIARMSPAEYRANEKAIYDALRAGTIRP